MARMGEIQFRGDGSDPKQVFNYMLQLEEQIKYALAHIGEENIEPGSIEMEQFGPVMKQSVQQITFDIQRQEAKSRQLASEDGRLRTLIITTEAGIMAQMEDLQEGLENEIQITAAGLTERIENSEGDITQLKTRATGLETRVTNAEGNITTFQETADAIGLSATGIDFDEATGNPTIKGSYFTIDKDGIDILSTGALTINTSNFTLDAQGNAGFGGTLNSPNGTIGGWTIGNGNLTSASGKMILSSDGTTDGITIRDRTNMQTFASGVSGNTQILALNLYDGTYDHGYIQVNDILARLNRYSWISDVAVAENTLIFYNTSGGEKLRYTPSSGGGSMTAADILNTLEAAVDAVSYNANNGTLTFYIGTYYYTIGGN